MASLRARHQVGCAIVTKRAEQKVREGKSGSAHLWTTFAGATKAHGCTCSPLYQVVIRGNPNILEPVGHNRKDAARALDALKGDIANKTFRKIPDKRFDLWADEWLESLTGKQTTKMVYKSTLDYAKATFGSRKVRDLAPSDIEHFLKRVKDANHRPATDDAPARDVSPATLAKHLRQLGACLAAAVPEFASSNPVRLLHKTKRPKVQKPVGVYFTNDEISRLWLALDKIERPAVLALAKMALLTGARFGELAALRWTDCDLLSTEVRISRTWTPKVGETSPKSGEGRTIDLTPPAAAVLEAWYRESGGGDGLVFKRDDGNGDREHFDSPSVLRQALYPSMERAGIPRVGERGRKRDWHSFRHSFARIALEGGSPLDWVSRQLGHSSVQLTFALYGEWSRTAQKAEAERLADAFTL